jgi:hypothetical protein
MGRLTTNSFSLYIVGNRAESACWLRRQGVLRGERAICGRLRARLRF